tara:strand:- start:25066 stop:26190 length:1125 start_codon:yes stop_codon:yes gene_type:complete
MAVTFTQTPQDWSPSDNPLRFTFSSAATLNANFSFIVQTYLDGVQIAEDRVFVERSGRAHYDASTVVKNLIQTPARSTSLYGEGGYSNEVYVKVIENYGTPAIDHLNATSSTINVYKACFSDKAWTLYDNTDWVELKFLTNYPRTERMYQLYAQDFYLNIITDSNVNSDLYINIYNSAGGLVDSLTSAMPTYLITQLNLNTDLLTGIGLTLTGASYYTVQVEGSEILTVEFITEYCNNPNTLQWLNEFGAYDSFVFLHNLEKSGDVKESTYGKQFGEWIGTSFDYNLKDVGTIRVGTKQKDKGVIYTDWISQAIQNWLVELYKSPRYYLIDVTGYVDYINVTSNSLTFKQQRFEDLINESVAFDYINEHNGISL